MQASMRAILFVNGQLTDLESVRRFLRADDYLIGADGGTLHCLALGQTPDVVVGDLDSLDASLLAQLVAQGVQIERHPPAKDQTDLELAIERAIRDGATEIILVGATGGRLDQTIANLLILAQRPWGVDIKVLDGKQLAQVLKPGETLTVQGQIGATVSVIPLSEQVTGITYTGLHYPLHQATLPFGSTRGISNQLAHPTATLQIETGLLLVVIDV